MENKNNRVYDFFKKGLLSEKTVIRLLIIMVCILLAYIAGTRFTEKFSEMPLPTISENATSEANENEADTDDIIKININSDSVFELCRIPGIGEAKANAIIEYRKENGDFFSIEELKRVKGIGDTTYEKLKEYIFVNN